MVTFTSRSEEQTKQIATQIAPYLQKGDCLAFFATLGMGKSVFCRAIIQAIMPEVTNVPSPTFTLVQTYSNDATEIWHFDLYRLEDPEEIFELGLDEALENAISLIEWPQNMGEFLPKNAIKVTIDAGNTPNERVILIDSHKKLF